MEFQDLRYERRGASAWITLDRPSELNALSRRFLDEADGALDLAEADPDVRAVVFTGAGRAFCAGADLKFILDMPTERRLEESNAFVARASALMDRIETMNLPTIAAVNGVATAGGMELVLCCDLVIAASGARLGDGHANFGLFPGAGGSIRLPRKVGVNRANLMFFTGDLLPVEDFVATGFVNRVVEPGDLIPAVDALVATLATKSRLGLARMKAMAAQAFDQPVAAGVRQEQLVSRLHATSFDRNEGIAAFTEKRTPQFQGR